MDVVIREISTGKILDIFPKFALENRMTSAFFSEEGSKAFSISLPKTDNNTRIFGYANILGRKNKSKKAIPVIIQKGSYSRKGVLYLSSTINTEFSYEATIAYNEANIYKLQSELKLTELPNLPFIEKNVDELIEDMNYLLTHDDLSNPLTIFMIYLKVQGTYKRTHTWQGEETEWTYEQQFILNEIDLDPATNKKWLRVKDYQFVLNEDEPLKISAAKGIGISPFIRAWYIIEKIAEHFGYEMGENPFKTEYQLRRLTLLNNTADAIVAGFLDYKQLMPDITISEFFQFLWGKFGAKVYIDGNTNTMHIRLLRDTLNQKDAKLLSISGECDYDEATPKQLKLSAGKNLDKSAVETDTYEEFCTKYNNIIGSFDDDYYEDGVGGVVLNKSCGLFFLAPMNKYDSEGEKYQEIKEISSIHFDWDKRSEGLEYVEITSPDECVTMSRYGRSGMNPYYGLEFALRNSIMEINREVEHREEPNKLAVCWDMGFYYNYYAEGRVNDTAKFGSIFPYRFTFREDYEYFEDTEGNLFKYALTYIGKDGLFEHFWKDYDAILRHSNNVVKGKLNLPPFELATLDMTQKFIVDNHPVLLTDYSYIVGNINVEKQEFNAMTLGLYEPYDLDKEQSHPKPQPILYKWELISTKEEKKQKKLDPIIEHYKKNRPPGYEITEYRYYEFKSAAWTQEKDENPPTMDGLWYYPPTEKDYQIPAIRGNAEHKLEAYCKLKFRVAEAFMAPQTEPSWIEKEYLLPKSIIDYESYFQAAKR